MLHGSETWPVRKENVVALQRAEMRMVPDQRPLNSCMCVCISKLIFSGSTDETLAYDKQLCTLSPVNFSS